ncbi:MAG: hypothetical protein ABI147_12210 [Acidobacteriaceae bacterium]
MFEPGKAWFDTVALTVEQKIVAALLFAVTLGRNDGHSSHRGDVIDYLLTVIALVGEYAVGLVLSQQSHGLGAVVDLSPGDEEVQWQTALIGQQMDLGRQASSGALQSLVRAPFLWPVAAC